MAVIVTTPVALTGVDLLTPVLSTIVASGIRSLRLPVVNSNVTLQAARRVSINRWDGTAWINIYTPSNH